METASFQSRVLGLIARIPTGQVATYGQIAALAGFPRRARHVGQTLAGLEPGHGLPWHRVIMASGRVARRGASHQKEPGVVERRQEHLLQAEGVALQGGRVALGQFRWQPTFGELWPETGEEHEQD